MSSIWRVDGDTIRPRESVGAGGDDTAALQEMIDVSIARRLKLALQAGRTYQTTEPLIVGVTGSFITFEMESTPGGFPTNPLSTSPSLQPATIKLTGDRALDSPVLIVQGGRGCKFSDISFVGGNTAPADIAASPGVSGGALFLTEFDDWVGAGVRTNVYSPQCAVAIDPFMPEFPAEDIDNCYPNLSGRYVAGAFGSSATLFVRCSFGGSYIGVAMSSPGPGAGGPDLVLNNENNVFDTCFWQYNTIHHSIGQSQARATEFHSPRMYASWIAVDTEHIGPGGTPGVGPVMHGAPNIGFCRYVFNVTDTAQMMRLQGAHFESIASLGRWWVGVSSVNAQGRISDCFIQFSTPEIAVGSQDEPDVPFHFSSNGVVEIQNCQMSHQAGSVGGFFRFWTKSGRMILNGVKLFGAALGTEDAIQFGAEKMDLGHVKITGPAHVRNTAGSAVYQDHLPPLTVVPINAGLLVDLQQGATVRTGTVALASTTGLTVGDVVYILETATPYQPEKFPDSVGAANYFGPIARISAIDPDVSITLQGLPKGWVFGDTRLRVVRWPATETIGSRLSNVSGLVVGAAGFVSVDSANVVSANGLLIRTTGSPVVPNNVPLTARNAANSADANVFTLSGSNNLIIGSTAGIGGLVEIFFDVAANNGINFRPHGGAITYRFDDSRFSSPRPVQMATYTVAGLPAASTAPRGIVWVSDEVGGAHFAYSDGTNWRRLDNDEIVSAT